MFTWLMAIQVFFFLSINLFHRESHMRHMWKASFCLHFLLLIFHHGKIFLKSFVYAKELFLTDAQKILWTQLTILLNQAMGSMIWSEYYHAAGALVCGPWGPHLNMLCHGYHTFDFILLSYNSHEREKKIKLRFLKLTQPHSE